MLMFLAQSYFAAPEALAEPGFVQTWFLERSMVTGIAVMVLGLIVLAGPGRGMKRGWMVALGIMAIGGAVWGVGEVVETDREAVLAGADAFYSAIGSADRAGAEAFMGPEVGLAAAGALLARDGRGLILGGIERLRDADLKELAVIDRQGESISAQSARTQTQLRAVFPGGGPNLVWVVLDWRRESDAWRVRGVDLVMLNGQSPGQGLLGAMR